MRCNVGKGLESEKVSKMRDLSSASLRDPSADG
jgi:hypothetical protein